MKILVALVLAALLVSVFASNQDAFGLEKQTTDKKSLVTSQPASKSSLRNNYFVSTDDWFFTILLPQGWSAKASFPFYFAGTEANGNHVIVDYSPIKKIFANRDDFHSYLTTTEMNLNGFNLGNSITTVSTNYGYKTMVELKLMKQDGNQIMMRKDFHFMSKEGKVYSVYGYSQEADSFKSLRKTLDTFKPTV